MNRYHTSIVGLIGFVVACGAGLAALRGPSGLSVSLTFSAALAALTLGLAGIVYRRGWRRAFWVGFCICGWTYAFLALDPFAREIRNVLVTTVVLNLADEAIFPVGPSPVPAAQGARPAGPSRWAVWTSVSRRNGGFAANSRYIVWTTPDFYDVGHALFTILHAALGGTIFRLAFNTRDRDEPSDPPAIDRTQEIPWLTNDTRCVGGNRPDRVAAAKRTCPGHPHRESCQSSQMGYAKLYYDQANIVCTTTTIAALRRDSTALRTGG